MPAIDTTFSSSFISAVQFFFKTKTRKATTLVVVVVAVYLIRKRMHKGEKGLAEIEKEADMFIKIKQSSGKGTVDSKFFRRMMRLVRIAIPGWRSSEAKYIIILSLFLVIRTILSIQLAEINGTVVHGLIKMDRKVFLTGLATILAYAIPSSIINSLLDYFSVMIALGFREKLTKHYHERYIKDKYFYQI